MPRQFLNGPRGRPTHRQVRTERVPEDMHARADVRPRRHPPHRHLHDLLRQGPPLPIAEHAGTRRWRAPFSASRSRSVIGTNRTRPPLVAVTWPFHSERATQSWRLPRSTSDHSSAIISPHRSPASPPSSTSRGRRPSIGPRRLHQPLVVRELMEAGRPLGTRSSRSRTAHDRSRPTPRPSRRATFSTVNTLLIVLGDLRPSALQPLHILGRDRIQRFAEHAESDGPRASSPLPRSRSASAVSPERDRR